MCPNCAGKFLWTKRTCMRVNHACRSHVQRAKAVAGAVDAETVMFDVDECLRHLIQVEGSDLHMKVPLPPTVRVHGELHQIEEIEALTPDDTNAALRHMLEDPEKLDEFDKEGEVDFAYALKGLA